MLGKLLKYDFKWVYKVVLIFNILAFVFAVIGRALSYIENSIVFTVLTRNLFWDFNKYDGKQFNKLYIEVMV